MRSNCLIFCLLFEESAPSTKSLSRECQTDSPSSEEDKEKIRELEEKVRNLEKNLNSARADLACERERTDQLVEDIQRKQELQNQRVLRARSVSEQTSENYSDNSNTPVDISATRDQANVIKTLQDAIDRERQERKELVEKLTKEAQKTKERELQQAVKRAVNKERLERERAIDDSVKKALEKYKQDRDKHIQKTLQLAKDEAQKTVQEAVRLTKKKQWCANCGNEAFYPCCWNTSYCTLECQKAHWCTHKFHCMRVPCNCSRDGPIARS